MITYLAKITARPGRKAELVDFLRWDAHVAAADEPGTLRFDVYDVADEPEAVYLYEAYASADAFAVHRDGPPFKKFVEDIVPNVIADIDFLLRGATSVAANA